MQTLTHHHPAIFSIAQHLSALLRIALGPLGARVAFINVLETLSKTVLCHKILLILPLSLLLNTRSATSKASSRSKKQSVRKKDLLTLASRFKILTSFSPRTRNRCLPPLPPLDFLLASIAALVVSMPLKSLLDFLVKY